MAGNERLIDEVARALAPDQERDAVAAWAAMTRRRLVPYLATSGAFVGAILGSIVGAAAVTGAPREDRGGLEAAIVAGIGIGVTVGWVAFSLAARIRIPGRSKFGLRALRTGLALPAYLAAASAAYLVAAFLRGSLDHAVASFSGPLMAALAFGLIAIPLGFAMSRKAHGSASPSGFPDALRGTIGGMQGSGLGPYSFAAISIVIWLIVATLGVFGLLSVLKALAPAGYAASAEAFSGLFGLAVLTMWVATIVAGAAYVIRLVFGGRPSRPRRRP